MRIDVVDKDANVEDIKQLVTRRGIWIPNQYVVLCLKKGLSPVDVWGRLYVSLRRDGNLEACSPLVDHL